MTNVILSVSVREELARQMEGLQKEMGFSGRSDMVRAGLDKLAQEHEQNKGLAGDVDCVILVVHDKRPEADITGYKHEFDDIITTQIHNNLRGGKCMELFVVSGSGERVHEMYDAFSRNRKIGHVKLVLA